MAGGGERSGPAVWRCSAGGGPGSPPRARPPQRNGTAASTLWTTLNPVDSSPDRMFQMRVPQTQIVQRAKTRSSVAWSRHEGDRTGARGGSERSDPGYLDPQVKSATQQGVAAMADITLEQFEQGSPDVPRRQRRAQGRGEGLHVGRGLRQGRALRRARPARASRRSWRRPKTWRARSSTPASAGSAGPSAYGGRELPNAYERRVELSSRASTHVPNQGFFGIGLGMVAPTILAHATDTAKDPYLKALYRGDIVACQLFSEPGAGSDLASLQTKAERDGDEWLITGQKVWTSGAQYSDIGEIICRTDPDLPKHKGLTGFIVDMRAPGRRGAPAAPDDRRGRRSTRCSSTRSGCADDHRLGDVNQGWTVALTTLMNERAVDRRRRRRRATPPASTHRLIEMVRHYGLDNDPIVRDELAGLVTDMKVASYTNQRAMDKIKPGQLPGPEMSIAKLALTDEHGSTVGVRGQRARRPHHRRLRRVGHLRLEPVRPGRPGHAHRRRHRRGHAEHRRRAGARPAEGPGHRLRRRRSAT